MVKLKVFNVDCLEIIDSYNVMSMSLGNGTYRHDIYFHMNISDKVTTTTL